MKNIQQITKNCFIVRTEAGFRKLLKHIRCYGKDAPYSYYLRQHTKDKSAFYQKSYPRYDDSGKAVLDDKGDVVMNTFDFSLQHPIKYPCIVSYQDDSFEALKYYLYVKYIPAHLKLDDFVEFEFDDVDRISLKKI